MAGEDHEIYVSSTGTLTVASNGGQPVAAIDRLRGLHSDYQARRPPPPERNGGGSSAR